MHSCKPICTFTSISKFQRENPILSITCYSKWNLAFAGVEGKTSVSSSTSSDKKSGLFHWTKSRMVCVHMCLLVGLVCPGFTSPLSVWPCFPCRQREGALLTLPSPGLIPDLILHGGGPLPLLKGAVCFQALIEFQLSWFYLEFSRQFCQNRLRREQIQLLLISNRLSFQGANLRMCHGYALSRRLVGAPGLNREGELLWLAVN